VHVRTVGCGSPRCCRSGPARYAHRRQIPAQQQPVENLSFGDRSRIRNQEIGFIFQSFNLIGDLTVEENVELPLTYSCRDAVWSAKRVKDALEA